MRKIVNLGVAFLCSVLGGAAPARAVDADARVHLSQSTVAILDQSTVAILDQSTVAILDQSTVAILDALDRSPTAFFDATAWAGYVNQGATDLIGVRQIREDSRNGRGTVVAVIDTGVDPGQPVLKGSLVPGFDFTRNTPGGSEWADIDQSTVAILDQSTVAILDQSTVAILDQSTVAILDGRVVPAAFGHGTMVSGLIHLVAPEAKIMPLKAFRADGFARTSDIVRAIHYAVDYGAKVINMSFSSDSQEVRGAIEYATGRGVICVGSAGNDGSETIVYPAALDRVLGVASTRLDDTIAPFSNYGHELVKVAAPGENLVTAYPGSRYGVVSGTSFSTGLVSGAAAVMAGVRPDLDYMSVMNALESSSHYLWEGLGYGRIDIAEAVGALGAIE